MKAGQAGMGAQSFLGSFCDALRIQSIRIDQGTGISEVGDDIGGDLSHFPFRKTRTEEGLRGDNYRSASVTTTPGRLG